MQGRIFAGLRHARRKKYGERKTKEMRGKRSLDRPSHETIDFEDNGFSIALVCFILITILVMYVGIEGSPIWDDSSTPRRIYKEICFAASGWIPGLYSACLWPDKLLYRSGSVSVVQSSSLVQLLFDEQVETELVLSEQGEYSEPADYVRNMARLVLEQMTPPNAGTILLLGVGGGSFFNELRHRRCEGCLRLIGVEADAEMLLLAERFFSPPDPQARDIPTEYVNDDAQAFLANTTELYYVVVNDCYVKEGDGVPPAVRTVEFMYEVRRRLVPGGRYMMNVVSNVNGTGQEPYKQAADRMRKVFPESVQVYLVRGRNMTLELQAGDLHATQADDDGAGEKADGAAQRRAYLPYMRARTDRTTHAHGRKQRFGGGIKRNQQYQISLASIDQDEEFNVIILGT
eukprot:CAMPEP_0198223130 /NCGR_PEP_ID=MMETSP1445-20131203/91145_1 /TAXON_ID=36898 /ORGANISM="Pyramimonas sp., Strain CCMP2087" /LENGTH=401 /DNA_ID=CAMNT_0043901875 /DNA_START=171 /DNA_END=1372 /DNA_ORIENTATION=+